MDKDQLERLIHALEMARQRPYMHMFSIQGKKNPAGNWLLGLHFALYALGLKKIAPTNQGADSIWQDVLAEHGWDMSNTAPFAQIERSGMSESEMIDELLAIQLEVWKRTLAKLDQQEDK